MSGEMPPPPRWILFIYFLLFLFVGPICIDLRLYYSLYCLLCRLRMDALGEFSVRMHSCFRFFRYRVVLFGDAGTGKTALVSQFMTSEYMHTYDASLGKCSKNVMFIIFLLPFVLRISFDVFWPLQNVKMWTHSFILKTLRSSMAIEKADFSEGDHWNG